jgi:hypothetical protein
VRSSIERASQSSLPNIHDAGKPFFRAASRRAVLPAQTSRIRVQFRWFKRYELVHRMASVATTSHRDCPRQSRVCTVLLFHVHHLTTFGFLLGNVSRSAPDDDAADGSKNHIGQLVDPIADTERTPSVEQPTPEGAVMVVGEELPMIRRDYLTPIMDSSHCVGMPLVWEAPEHCWTGPPTTTPIHFISNSPLTTFPAILATMRRPRCRYNMWGK